MSNGRKLELEGDAEGKGVDVLFCFVAATAPWTYWNCARAAALHDLQYKQVVSKNVRLHMTHKFRECLPTH